MLRVVENATSAVVTIHSPVLGRIDVPASSIVEFVEPIAGFPGCARYALMPYVQDGREDAAMRWLQAVDPPYHTFLVTDPWNAVPQYQPEIAPSDVVDLGAREFGETTLLGIITVSREARELTINLQAPLLVNLEQGLARQVLILNGESYGTRTRVCELP